MMHAIAIAITATLTIIAALHAYWALGGLWPGTSKPDLATIVYGKKATAGSSGPPSRLTGLVAALIAGAAGWPLIVAPLVSRFVAPEIAAAGTWLLATVFLVRGVAGYSSFMTRQFSTEPFATYNRKYYSPLCLMLGGGFLYLALNGGTG